MAERNEDELVDEIETVEEPETEEQEPEEAGPDDARARRMGWVPESEWDEARAAADGRRKPARFLTAAEFIEKVESDLPVLRERNRFLDQEVQRFSSKLDETTERLTDVSKLVQNLHKQSVEAGRRAYEKAKAELEEKMNQAVEEADTEGYRASKERLAQLEQEAPAAMAEAEARAEADGKPPAEKPAAAKPNPVVTQWVSDNPWFNRNPDLQQIASAVHGRLLREEPNLPLRENLDKVADEVRRRFPEYFENQARNAPGAVTKPAPGRQRGSGKTWADVPADDRQAYETLKKQFENHGQKYTRDQYLADYQWS